MSAKNKKKEFDWKKGSRLTPDRYDPIGNVREVGFTKISDGILADPVSRKRERKKKLIRLASPKDSEKFFEESESGLKEDFTPTDASKLIGKGSRRIKGIDRFKKSSSSSDPKKKKS